MTLSALFPGGLRQLARQGLLQTARLLGIGTLIAVLISVLFRQTFGPTWVYTLCITLACWSVIQGGLRGARRLAGEGRPGWPPLPWTVAMVLVGTPVGYTLGNAAANLLTGLHSPGLLGVAPRQALTMLLISLLSAVAFTFYFYARERVATAEAQAQAAQRLAAENQLRMLQSQLEPHMLFNTLANLRVLIGLDAVRAQAMLDHLINFLRATLVASRAGSHPLAAEFDRLADYLALMKIRMGPRLAVDLQLPDELRSLPVPALLLQPLVENAIKHGLEPQVAGGRIAVAARRNGERLVLTVHDTGVGLQAAAATAGPGSGFGVVQVRERLAALHGARGVLRLEAAPGGGTLATLEMPIT